MSMVEQIGQGAGAKVVAMGLWGGAATSVLGVAAQVDAAAWGGLLVGVVGLCANIYHRRRIRAMEWRRLQLDADRLELDRQRMKCSCGSVPPDQG